MKSSQDKYLSKEEIEELQKTLKIETKWNLIKKGGKDSIPSGDTYSAYERIDSSLKEIRIYLPPVGK